MPLVYRDIGISKSGTQWEALSGEFCIAKVWKNVWLDAAGLTERR